MYLQLIKQALEAHLLYTLNHSNDTVYILEDHYKRYERFFDECIMIIHSYGGGDVVFNCGDNWIEFEFSFLSEYFTRHSIRIINTEK